MADCDVRYGFFNLVDQSETDITASSENTFFPSSNLKSPFSSKVFRSETGTASANVVFDFKTVENVDMICVRADRSNGWGFTGDLTIEANIADSWGSPAYSTTISYNSNFDIAVKLLTSAESYRYWRVSGTGSQYLELSNLFIGKYFNAGKNLSLNWKYADKSLDKVQFNKFGQDFVTEYGYIKQISGDIKLLDKTEMKSLKDELDYVGISKPVWVVLDPTETFSSDIELFAGQYRVTKIPAWTNIAYNYYNTSISLKEFK